jgi:hypothetical protein
MHYLTPQQFVLKRIDIALVPDRHYNDTSTLLLRMSYADDCRVALLADKHWTKFREIVTFMPAKKKKDSVRAPWRGFVNINLSVADKPEVDKYSKQKNVSLESLLETFVNSGHSFSIKYDSTNDCFMCAMKCDETDNGNAGLCITSRGGSVMDVLWLSMYKHFVYCETDWEQYFTGGTKTENWG